MQKSLSLRIFSQLLVVVVSLGLVNACEAGPFRDRIKEKIKSRLQDKFESQPAPETTAKTTDKIIKPGDYTFSVQHDGLTRYYKVHVPESYNPSNPTPLLLALHGGGGDMNIQSTEKYYHQISASEKYGNIVAFPNGYSPFPSGKFATWNSGDCCGGARDKNIDDVGFIRQIITHLSRQMNIDRSQIFATGMSNGGMMAQRLACEMADTFKAVASVAGPDETFQCTPSRPISVMNIHAKDDDHVLFNGGAGEGAFSDTTKVAQFTGIPETISRWVKRNGCDVSPQRVLDKPGVYCDQYSQCNDDVKVELCVTETGGHSWPGGTKPREGKSTISPSNAISANDVMWEFFNNQK